MTHRDRSERRKQMAAAVELGASLAEVAAEYDVDSATVKKAHEAAGFVAKDKRQHTLELVADLLNTNLSLRQLADNHELLACSVAKLYRRCIAAGIKVRERKRGRPCM